MQAESNGRPNCIRGEYTFSDDQIEDVSKVKIFYHKVHKDFSQSSQRIDFQHLKFVFFVLSLCSLWLKKTFETAPIARQKLLSEKLQRAIAIAKGHYVNNKKNCNFTI